MPGMYGRQFADDARAIGIADDRDNVLGVVVFHQWQPDHGTIQVSAAASDPRWLRARKAVDAMFDYGFNTCGCHKLWSATPRSNRRALKFVWGLGFQPEAILSHHYGSEDVVISRKFHWEHYTDVFAQSAHAA